MKLEVTHENLAKALGMVARTVGVRSALPILNNVLLKTEKGRLRLSATDLEVGITTWIGAKIDQEGAYTVPAKLFGDYIAAASGKTIRMEQQEGTLRVTTEEGEAAIKGLPADEFPLIPQIEGEPLLLISPLRFKEALRKTVVAAAIDETRPTLSGVLLWKEKGELRVTATDSYRLSEAKVSVEKSGRNDAKKSGGTTKVIVPHRVAQELIRLLEAADEEVALAVSENQALFKTSSMTLVSRLIEGEFPNYVDIIPAKGTTTVTTATEELLRAIKVASLFAREVGNHITLSVHPKGSLEVRATSPQVGENVANISATIAGEEQSVSFNARFLQDAVASIGSKETQILLTGKTSPAVFREEGNTDFLHLVMPLRTEG